jgi:hypothetical protein
MHWQKIALIGWSLSILTLLTPNLMAFEEVGMRSFQSGPVGEGFVFAPQRGTEVEVLAIGATTTGQEKKNNGTEKFQGDELRIAAATAFQATDTAQIYLQLNHTQRHISSKDNNIKSTFKANDSEFGAGSNVWIGDFLLGVQTSALHLGQESKSAGNLDVTTNAVTIPRLRLFTGIRSGSVSAMARSLLYSHGETTRTTKQLSTEEKQNIKRRTAAETSIDTRIQFDPLFSLAGSVTYIDAERASDNNKNSHFVYAVGGLYSATETLSLAGSIHYTDPHYKKGADASIVDDNLGGLVIDIGSKFIMAAATTSFNVSYTLPEKAEYQADASRDSVTIERARWALTIGLNLLFR